MFIRATGARINKANMQLDPKKRKDTAVGRILASMSGDYQQFVKAGPQLAKAKVLQHCHTTTNYRHCTRPGNWYCNLLLYTQIHTFTTKY